MTLPLSARSKVDWWQGHSRWWVCCSHSEIGQPTWVQILEKHKMPSTPQFSRPGHGVMSSGCIRTMIDRGLGLLGLQRDALVDRLAVLLLEEHRGLAVDQLADLHVGGLDRGAVDVLDDAHPLLPDRVVELVARQRAEVAQREDRHDARGRPWRRAASCGSAGGGRCRTPRARSAGSPPSRCGPRRRSEPGWRYSTISWSLISLRAHWIMPTPMHSSARPRQTPRATLEAPRPRISVGSSPILKTK